MNIYDHDVVSLVIPRSVYIVLLDKDYQRKIDPGHLRELHDAACQDDHEYTLFRNLLSDLPEKLEQQRAWCRVVDGAMIAVAIFGVVALFQFLLST